MKRMKILNRDPPDWQLQKVLLAKSMVRSLDEINRKLDVIIEKLGEKESTTT